jgi:hypothetical protein
VRKRKPRFQKLPSGKIQELAPTFIMPMDPATFQRIVQPTFEKVHKIGGCSLIRYRVVAGGAPSYLCSYKGVRADRLTAKAALQSVREQVPQRTKRQVGEIPAFRAWKLMGDNLVPVAMSKLVDYDAGAVLKSDFKPTLDNKTGLWAVKTERWLRDVVRTYEADVWGEVGLFGRVVEHEHGWRAEKLVIRKLHMLFPASRGLCNILGQRYDCEVVVDPEV